MKKKVIAVLLLAMYGWIIPPATTVGNNDVLTFQKYEAPQIYGPPAPPPKPEIKIVKKVLPKVTANACSCVLYAKAKSGINVGSIGKAKNHPINNSEPAVGAIVVMSVDSGYYKNTGHLAVVVDMDDATITLSEANYVPCKVGSRTILKTDPTIRGYYY